MKIGQLYPSNTPPEVATALPPLNFAKIGNICPMTAQLQVEEDGSLLN